MLHSPSQLKILITGAAGFIGTNLLKALSKKHTVMAGLHYRNEKKMVFQAKKLKRIAQPASIISGNVADGFISLDRMRELDVNVVIYAAGQCDVNQAAQESKEGDWKNTSTMQVNAYGPQKLAEICSFLVKEGRSIKFIYLSSIYASDVKEHISHSPDHAPEKHYGCSKRFGEQLLESYPLLDITIVRLPRMIGSHQHTSALACRLRENILFGRRLPLLDDNKMSFTPAQVLNDEMSSLLVKPFVSGAYSIKMLSSEADITSSSQELAETFDQVISKRLSFTPLFQNVTQHNPQLSSLAKEIVENRVEHFQDAARTIQKAYRQHKSKKEM